MLTLTDPAAVLAAWPKIKSLAPLTAIGLVSAVESHQLLIADALAAADALTAEIATVQAERDVWRNAIPKPPAPVPPVMTTTVAAHQLRLDNLNGVLRGKQAEVVKLTGERDSFLAQLVRLVPGLENLAIAAPPAVPPRPAVTVGLPAKA